jgi:competence protein ComEA
VPTERLRLVAVLGAVALAVAGGLYFGRGPEPLPPLTGQAPDVTTTEVIVHVSGAVAEPGLVSLPPKARIADAVAAAGGASADADLAAINLAGTVQDGDQVVVPALGDDAVSAASSGIDLNRSTADQLAQLNGIGPVLAERIVAYREEHGPFETIEDLLDVPGIGEAKLAMLRDGVGAP